MPVTITAEVGQSIYFDPGDVAGPYTVDFPPPAELFDAAWFRILPTTNSRTHVTLNGNGTNLYGRGSQTAVASVTFPMAGDVIEFQYNIVRNQWVSSGGLRYRAEYADEGYQGDGSTPSMPVGGVTLPLVSLIGGGTRFSLAAGILTALVDLPSVVFEGVAIITMDLGQNTECIPSLVVELTRNGSSGTAISIPGLYPFQSSRVGFFEAKLVAAAVFVTMEVGDTVRLVGAIDVGSRPAVADAWLLNIGESPIFPQAP